MLVKEIMTKNTVFISPTESVADAAARMRDMGVGSLPVGENDRLIGMVTDRDITVRAVAEKKDPAKTTIKDVLSEKIQYCYDDDDISEAVKQMKNNKIRRLVVLNRDKRMVGFCSLGDIAIGSDDSNQVSEVLEEVSRPADVP